MHVGDRIYVQTRARSRRFSRWFFWQVGGMHVPRHRRNYYRDHRENSHRPRNRSHAHTRGSHRDTELARATGVEKKIIKVTPCNSAVRETFPLYNSMR